MNFMQIDKIFSHTASMFMQANVTLNLHLLMLFSHNIT